MPRRVPDYAKQFTDFNLIATIGAFGFGLSQLLFLYVVLNCIRDGSAAPARPWDGATRSSGRCRRRRRITRSRRRPYHVTWMATARGEPGGPPDQPDTPRDHRRAGQRTAHGARPRVDRRGVFRRHHLRAVFGGPTSAMRVLGLRRDRCSCSSPSAGTCGNERAVSIDATARQPTACSAPTARWWASSRSSSS